MLKPGERCCEDHGWGRDGVQGASPRALERHHEGGGGDRRRVRRRAALGVPPRPLRRVVGIGAARSFASAGGAVGRRGRLRLRLDKLVRPQPEERQEDEDHLEDREGQRAEERAAEPARSSRPPAPMIIFMRCASSLGHVATRWPSPPQKAHPFESSSSAVAPPASLGSSSVARTGGMRCLASRSKCFRSSRIVSSQFLLMKVVATPVLPQRPVRPMRCT